MIDVLDLREVQGTTDFVATFWQAWSASVAAAAYDEITGPAPNAGTILSAWKLVSFPVALRGAPYLLFQEAMNLWMASDRRTDARN